MEDVWHVIILFYTLPCWVNEIAFISDVTSFNIYSVGHLKRGIQDFHITYVLVPADKAANNVVVV